LTIGGWLNQKPTLAPLPKAVDEDPIVPEQKVEF